MTESAFPPPPKVRESRFDDWMLRFYKGVDFGTIGAGQWTVSGSNVYRSTGSVGVGAAPLYKMHIVGSSAAYSGGTTGILTVSTGTGANTDEQLRFGIVDGSYAWVQALKLGTAYRSLVLQHSGGDVGVGLTSPSHKLHVAGSSTFAIGTTSNAGGHATISAPGSPVSVRETFGTDGTGWQKRWAKNQGGTTTDLMTLTDKGVLHSNPSYINVKAPQYGATGDGTTDDTTAISSALTDAAANGMRRVYFPQGTYRTTSALTIAGDWFLFGDGPSTSIIKVDHGGNGIVHTGNLNTRENDKLTVMHLGLRSNNSSAGTAIKGTWTNIGSGAIAAQPSCLIFDVEVASSAANLAFTKGVELIGANHGTIEKLCVYGYESGIVSGSYGIYLDGAAGSPNLTDFKVRDCTIHYIETGAHCVDTEGVHFNQNTFLSCKDGIVFDTTLTVGKPYFDVTGNHIACGRYGIYSNEMVQFIIGDNLIYGLTSTSSSTTFNGIRIATGSIDSGKNLNSIVRDNIIIAQEDSGTFSVQNYGIHVLGGTGTGESILFKGNRTEGCDRLIYLDSSCVNVVIADDNTSSTGETWEDVSALNSLPYGTYTPTPYAVTNIGLDTDIDPYEANWVRVGNFVTVYGDVDIDPTAANASTTFRLSLPPECPCNVSAATQCSGVITPSGPNSPSGTATMHTATSPDRVEFNLYVTFSTPTRLSYTYRYRTA